MAMLAMFDDYPVLRFYSLSEKMNFNVKAFRFAV